MTEATRRRRLRATFEEVPELYDAARPLYPPQVFGDLVELASRDAGSRVLEIGPGTGQATVPLAERAKRVQLLGEGGALAVVSLKHVLAPGGEALYSRIRERIGDRKVSKTLQAILNVAGRL